MNLLEPKDVVIREQNFIISKFNCILGREIIAKYPVVNAPKIGNYEDSEKAMFKLMSCVAVKLSDGTVLNLDNKELIANHVKDAETLILIEKEMMVYNYSFFQNGVLSSFLEGVTKTVTLKVTEMLTSLSASLSQAKKQR